MLVQSSECLRIWVIGFHGVDGLARDPGGRKLQGDRARPTHSPGRANGSRACQQGPRASETAERRRGCKGWTISHTHVRNCPQQRCRCHDGAQAREPGRVPPSGHKCSKYQMPRTSLAACSFASSLGPVGAQTRHSLITWQRCTVRSASQSHRSTTQADSS